MNPFCGRAAAASALIVIAASSWSADWDGEVVQLYGGVYSPDCGNPSAPRLRASKEGLSVEVGNHRMTGTHVQVSMAPFGMQQPTPGQQIVALISEVRGGLGLTFWVHRDQSGQFIELEGDPKVAAALGKGLIAQRFRDCDVARSQRTASQAVADVKQASADAAAAAAAQRTPSAIRFKTAYLRALGGKAKEEWLLSEVGRPTDATTVTIAGINYQQLTGCKPHDCGDNNALVLYAPATGALYGKVLLRNVPSLIGSPPPPVAAELDRLWRAEWRQGQ